MKTILLFGFAILLTTQTDDPTSNPEFVYPMIKKHGGVVVIPGAAHQPKRNTKVLLDISSDGKSGSVIKGLDRAALILNQYVHQGIKPGDDFKMAIVLHGPATKAALVHEAFSAHSNVYLREREERKNPNLELIGQLKRAGVEIFVCGQALAHREFATTEVSNEIAIATSASSVNINLQFEGYACVAFK